MLQLSMQRLFVSTDWLQSNLDRVTVIEGGFDPQDHAARRIPISIFWDLSPDMARPLSDPQAMRAQLERLLRTAGIGRGDTLVFTGPFTLIGGALAWRAVVRAAKRSRFGRRQRPMALRESSPPERRARAGRALRDHARRARRGSVRPRRDGDLSRLKRRAARKAGCRPGKAARDAGKPRFSGRLFAPGFGRGQALDIIQTPLDPKRKRRFIGANGGRHDDISFAFGRIGFVAQTFGALDFEQLSLVIGREGSAKPTSGSEAKTRPP